MLIPRFSVEPEYELQEGCRCGSCYERTGRWKVCDINDIEENQYFDTEKEANKKCEELNKSTEVLLFSSSCNLTFVEG